MDTNYSTGKEGIQQPPNNNNNKWQIRLSNWIREAIAILLWGYAITKLFIFDIDNYLIEKFSPDYAWLLNYKFFILIGTVAVIWLVTKNKHILLWSLFIFFYPVIILFWRIPFFIFKNKSWDLAFAFLDPIISLAKSFKRSFITTAFFLVSTAIILGSFNKILLYLSICILMIIVLLVYIRRFILIFKPSGIYQAYSNFFSFAGNNVRNSSTVKLDVKIRKLPIEKMKKEQLQQWVSEVQNVVLFNRLCVFVARRLKNFQNSGYNIVSSIFGILLLVFFTIFAFAVINFGFFKINQGFYLFSNSPSFFTFFYYSFGVLLLNPIQELAATVPITQTILMVESFFAFFIAGILISLVLSVRSQRDTAELNEVIKNLTEEGKRAEGFIKDNYHLDNINMALEALQQFQGTIIDLLYKITGNIDEIQ